MKKLEEIVDFAKYKAVNHGKEKLASKGNLRVRLGSHYKFSSPEHDKEYEAFRNYADESTFINGHLWDMHRNPDYKTRHQSIFPDRIKHMDNFINSHKTPEALTVYSGTKHDPRKLMNHEGVIHHPAYLSTSISRGRAIQFAEGNASVRWDDDGNKSFNTHMLKIHVPKGHKGFYLGAYSHQPVEQEFILPRGLNMKYKKTSLLEANSHEGVPHFHHIHHMEIV